MSHDGLDSIRAYQSLIFFSAYAYWRCRIRFQLIDLSYFLVLMPILWVWHCRMGILFFQAHYRHSNFEGTVISRARHLWCSSHHQRHEDIASKVSYTSRSSNNPRFTVFLCGIRSPPHVRYNLMVWKRLFFASAIRPDFICATVVIKIKCQHIRTLCRLQSVFACQLKFWIGAEWAVEFVVRCDLRGGGGGERNTDTQTLCCWDRQYEA